MPDESELEAAIERLLAPERFSEAERIVAVRALLAEEARMGMMVGVAVGWALKEEMTEPADSKGES